MRHRLAAAVTIAGTLTLAACARPGGAPPSAQASAAGGPALAQPRHCGLRTLGHSVRPGEDLQVLLTVPADSQWCFDGVRLTGSNTEGQSIAQAPGHGALRLVHQPGSVIFGYRPAPGFSGTDHFRIAVPAQIETMYFAATVSVTAAN